MPHREKTVSLDVRVAAQDVGKIINTMLNHEGDPAVGFALIVCQAGAPDVEPDIHRSMYNSNLRRSDAIKLMRRYIEEFEAEMAESAET